MVYTQYIVLFKDFLLNQPHGLECATYQTIVNKTRKDLAISIYRIQILGLRKSHFLLGILNTAHFQERLKSGLDVRLVNIKFKIIYDENDHNCSIYFGNLLIKEFHPLLIY